MPRGGARPGAGRPTDAQREERKTRAAKTLAKCQEKIQAKLPEMIDQMITNALNGDSKALEYLVSMGLGKPATKQITTPDTEIKVVLGNIPRPKRGGEDAGSAEEAEEVEAPAGDEEAEEVAVDDDLQELVR